MAPEVAAVLQEWRRLGDRLPRADQLLFPNSKGNPLDSDTFHRGWTRHMQEIGLSRPIGECNNRRWRGGDGIVSKYHFHALRHVCASLLIEQKLPILEVSKFMGHSEVRITENVYGHLFSDNDQAVQAVAKLGAQVFAS